MKLAGDRESSRRQRSLLNTAALALGFVIMAGLWPGQAQINPPLGPYLHPAPEELAQAVRYGTNDPVVLTSYFYWYDVFTGAHLYNADGSDALTDHPPTLAGFSYKLASWHREQLEDMVAAGIDVLLPVYWGEPSQRIPGKPALSQPWSYAGLVRLVEARQTLLDAGQKPPAIGMFYDTSTLEYNAAGRKIDLTTDYGRRWFYESIRDFFSLIPARHWATIEGRPIIFLYSAAFAAAHDQSCIDYTRQEFARDFSGVTPYIVKEISWNVQADNTYAWGGAISLRNPGVAALGPGYDHSAVPGRDPLIVPREDGAFFERQWIRFLRAPSRLLHVETWNEYHEGTDIAASREYGRQYIELNRRFADLFKAGIKPPRPRGPYSDFKAVSVVLQATNDARGLTQFEFADGATTPAQIGGRACRVVAPTMYPGRYVYFQIHDSFKWADRMLVDVEVEYFDQGSGTFRIEYDGPDPNAPFNGAYTASATTVRLANSRQWKTAQFRLTEARFLNSQNGGADFRIAVQGDPVHFGTVTVSRLGMPAEAGASVNGWQWDFERPPDRSWFARGDLTEFRTANGLLRFGPVRATAAILAGAVVEATYPVEILARLRVAGLAPGTAPLGGLAVAVEPEQGRGVSILFRRNPAGASQLGLAASGEPAPAFVDARWETNRWFWLRVRHEPKTQSGWPDVWTRLWPADGETPEPTLWTAWRDFDPLRPPVPALVGFVGGDGALEVDWLLVRSASLPRITAAPPAFKPAHARLAPVGYDDKGGMRLSLMGEPNTGYVIEGTSDFTAWDGTAITTDTGGEAQLADRTPRPRRFYRARLAN
ncbi:MAG: DUF5010 domain-containing protein [Verrucomicrobia bacterium]|nr:DUF5010 domain-containing protein [Verrucomicrobiota bacterium]